MKQHIIILLSTFALLGIPHADNLFYNSLSYDARIINGNGITPRSEIKEWRYKIENGVLYKRLYNCTTNKWEGNWIRC